MAKGGEIYEAFYDTKSSSLYRWLPFLVLGKTLNCPDPRFIRHLYILHFPDAAGEDTNLLQLQIPIRP